MVTYYMPEPDTPSNIKQKLYFTGWSKSKAL